MGPEPECPGRPEGGSHPVRRQGSTAVELDDNVALYDDVGQLLIMLNSSAALSGRFQLMPNSRTIARVT